MAKTLTHVTSPIERAPNRNSTLITRRCSLANITSLIATMLNYHKQNNVYELRHSSYWMYLF
jgi:hypothetical protein